MYCHKCGTELPADANFCAKCGTKTVSVSSAKVEEQVQAVSLVQTETPAEGQQQTTLLDELTTLEAIRERGALTDGEFHGAKAKTLDQPDTPSVRGSVASQTNSTTSIAHKNGQDFGEPKSNLLLVVQNSVGVMLFCLFHRGVWSGLNIGFQWSLGIWLVQVLVSFGFAGFITGIAFVFSPKAMRTTWLKVFVPVAWILSTILVVGSYFVGRS